VLDANEPPADRPRRSRLDGNLELTEHRVPKATDRLGLGIGKHLEAESRDAAQARLRFQRVLLCRIEIGWCYE
jgi:hypothetical protein